MDDTRKIFVLRNGCREGPFSPNATKAAVRLGTISPQCPAFLGDDPRYRTLADILEEAGIGADPVCEPAPPPTAAPHFPKRRKTPASRHRIFAAGIAAVLLTTPFLFLPNEGLSEAGEGENPLGEAPGGKPGSNSPSPQSGRDAPAIASNIREAEQCILMVRTNGGGASAFFARQQGQTYIYTNVHAISDTDCMFIDFRGVHIPVAGDAETVADDGGLGMDIVRFRTLSEPAFVLEFANRAEIEAKPAVHTLGDSGGQGVLLSLPGRIKGIGPYKIEVDCEFIPGNSGGPIVTDSARVAGIASYVTTDSTIWSEGTQHRVRRFGWIPHDRIRWQTTTMAQLVAEQDLVLGSARTSRLLAAVSLLKVTETGFGWPEDLTVEGDYLFSEIINDAKGHPLLEDLNATDEAVRHFGGSRSAKPEILKEYGRFFDSCGRYADRELQRAMKNVHSAFWKKSLRDRLEAQQEITVSFRHVAGMFKASGTLDISLSDF